MPATTLMAAFVHRHARKLALSALFLTAVVLSVSFVASVHGVNRLALEKVVVFSHRQAPEMLAIDTADTVPRLQNALDILDATTRHSAVEEATGSKDSLAEAQKLVDEYGAGSFSSVADSPAAITAPHHDVQAFSSTSDGLALAPPLPGSVEPAYTSLSAHWVPMKAASHQAAVLASSGSQCFDVKNLKKFLPPGFGSVLKSAKKGSNPLDKFLTKAMLPTFGELQGAVKCVPSIAKALKTAARSPKAALSALATIDKCMTNLASISDKCQSSPSMLALSAVPKAGPMVSYVCGLLSKLVEKYMFVKEHVDKARNPPVFQCSLSKAAVDPHAQLFIASHARRYPSQPVVSYHQLLRVIQSYEVVDGNVVAPLKSELIVNKIKKAANKAGSAIKKTANKAADGIKKLDPMKVLDGLLKKAQLPTFKELVSIVKCVVPVGKGLKKLLGRPSLSQANAVFKTMDGCMCKLDKLSQQCEGPAVMLVSTQDPVGQVVGYVCSMAAKAVSKYTVIRDEIQQGISVVSLVGKAAKAASSSSKSGTNGKSNAQPSSTDGKPKSKPPSRKRAKLIIKSIKKVANKVKDGVKSIGNPLDMGLKKAGLPTFKEMGQVLKCTVTISKSFKSLIKARDSSALLKVINTMDGCVSKLATLSEKCDGPAVMAASMVPFGVGNAVSTVCSTASSVVEKYRGFTGALAAAGFNSDACPAGSSSGGVAAGEGKTKKSSASKGKGKGNKSPSGKGKGNKSPSGKGKGKKSPSGKGKGSKSPSGKGKGNKSPASSESESSSDSSSDSSPSSSKSKRSSSGKGKVKKSRPSKGKAEKSRRRAPPPPAVIFRQDRGGGAEAYSPPWNVYLLWTPSMQNMREYSETSTTSSEFVRRALRMGSRTAGTVDPHESHFLSGGFDSPKFVNDLANTCCSVVVAPPFENGFDVYSPADKTEARIQQRLRDYVANGNSIVVTGGIMSQLFLNRNFLTQLEPVSGNYDDGPFRLNIRFQKATATRGSQFNKLGFDVLEQMGHNVYAIDAKSLPPQSQIVFNSMDGGAVVVVVPYCQGFPSQYDNSQSPVAISADRCDYLKAKSRRLGRTRPDQAPCSCGSLVYLGFDYSDFSDMPSDVRRWVKVLRAASATTWGTGSDSGREDNEVLNNQRNFQ